MKVLASGEIDTIASKKRTEQEKQATEIIASHFVNCDQLVDNLGKGTALQSDGSRKSFTDNIPLGFKVQKGILECK